MKIKTKKLHICFVSLTFVNCQILKKEEEKEEKKRFGSLSENGVLFVGPIQPNNILGA